MKTNKFFQLITMAICAVAFAFVTGCEGPAGPKGDVGPQGEQGPQGEKGDDGTPGVAGNVTCLECHSAEFPDIIQEQFQQSAHSAGAIAVDYAGSRASCARCHSHEGYIEYARTGGVEQNIQNPSAWECRTCHNIHTTFEEGDFAFRLGDPVTLLFDETTEIDLGNSNTCANCHQSRRGTPYDMGGEMVDLDGDDIAETEVPAGHFYISSTHYGPHHGPQANVLYGVGFAEVAGSVSYPTAGGSNHMDADAGRCVGCHMYDYEDGEGGHTFWPALGACNACHTDPSENFNYGGVQTDTEGDLEELYTLLFNAGVVDVDGHPIVGIYPLAQANAFFNYIGLEEDRSLGVHNPKYVGALLSNTIESLQ